MTEDELRAAIRRKVMTLLPTAMMMAGIAQRLEPLLDQTLVRIICRDLLPKAEILKEKQIEDLFDLHVHETGDRNVVPNLSPVEAVEHAVEWLMWSIRSDVAWLSNLDEDGGVKKLRKFGSIPSMTAEADRSIARHQAAHTEIEDDEDSQTVHVLADGYRVVQLKTPKALRNETAMMQHCVGLGGYDSALINGEKTIYSLRDGKNRSHATMDVKTGSRVVVELRGKQNRMPILRYRQILVPFLDAQQFDWGRSTSHSGFLVSEDNRHFPYELFPKDMAVRDLDVAGYRQEIDPRNLPRFLNVSFGAGKVLPFPDGTHFPGNVTFSGTQMDGLPKGMVVEGNLTIEGTGLQSLPSDLWVKGHLTVSNAHIRSLPETLRFGTFKSGNSMVFAHGATISGSLDLSGSYSNPTLGDGMLIEGDLNLSGTALTRLPNDLTVLGSLNISRTRIEHLPENLRVGGSLIAAESDLMSLIGWREVAGDLNISRTRIESLPRGLHVHGKLDASGTLMRRLPIGIRVDGDADLSLTDIDSLPLRSRIQGNVTVTQTLRRWPWGGVVLGKIVMAPGSGAIPKTAADQWNRRWIQEMQRV